MNRSRLSFPCGAATAISLLAGSFAFLAQGERAPQTDSSQATLLEGVHVVKLPRRESGYRNLAGAAGSPPREMVPIYDKLGFDEQELITTVLKDLGFQVYPFAT